MIKTRKDVLEKTDHMYKTFPRDEVVSAQQLAHRYSVDRRTIYRYIKLLRMRGLSIISDKGSGGGYLLRSKK